MQRNGSPRVANAPLRFENTSEYGQVGHFMFPAKENSIKRPLTLDAIGVPSEDAVARELEGEILTVPLLAGIDGFEGGLCALNPAGQAIRQKLDGRRRLKDVAALLALLESDVLGFANEMVQREILAARGQGKRINQ